jgi:hypothetical protein
LEVGLKFTTKANFQEKSICTFRLDLLLFRVPNTGLMETSDMQEQTEFAGQVPSQTEFWTETAE